MKTEKKNLVAGLIRVKAESIFVCKKGQFEATCGYGHILHFATS